MLFFFFNCIVLVYLFYSCIYNADIIDTLEMPVYALPYIILSFVLFIRNKDMIIFLSANKMYVKFTIMEI